MVVDPGAERWQKERERERGCLPVLLLDKGHLRFAACPQATDVCKLPAKPIEGEKGMIHMLLDTRGLRLPVPSLNTVTYSRVDD